MVCGPGAARRLDRRPAAARRAGARPGPAGRRGRRSHATRRCSTTWSPSAASSRPRSRAAARRMRPSRRPAVELGDDEERLARPAGRRRPASRRRRCAAGTRRRRPGPGPAGRGRRGRAPRPAAAGSAARRRATPGRRASSSGPAPGPAQGAPVGQRVAGARVGEQPHPLADVGGQLVGPAPQHVALLEQGGQQAGQPACPWPPAADDHAGQAGVQRQVDHGPARAPVGAAVGVERPELDEQGAGRRPGPRPAAGRGTARSPAAVPQTASSRASPARSTWRSRGRRTGRRAACSTFDHRR